MDREYKLDEVDDAPKNSVVYAIKNSTNGKLYIGSATNCCERWREHKRGLLKGNHHNVYLQNSFDKHGESAFTFSILNEIDDKTQLIAYEQAAMDQFESANNEFGYNISPTAGSQLGFRFSEESRARMSESRRGRERSPEHCASISAALIGKSRPLEVRAKMSKSCMGRKASPETRAKMSAAHRERYKDPRERAKTGDAGRGQKRSPETIAKISEANRRHYEDPDVRARHRIACRERYWRAREKRESEHAERLLHCFLIPLLGLIANQVPPDQARAMTKAEASNYMQEVLGWQKRA